MSEQLQKKKILNMVSPSQVSTFDSDRDPRTACQRRWYLEKIAGFTSPPGAGQVLGSTLHSEIESYYQHGVQPTSPILIPGMPLWPERGEHTICETWFALPVEGWPDDRPQKYLDFADAKGMPWGYGRFVGKPDVLHVGGPRPEVVDFKNYKSLSYIPKEDELRTSPAMIAYGRVALSHRPDADRVQVGYVVHKTSTPHKAKKVVVEMSRGEIVSGWQGIVQTVSRMRQLAVIDDWHDAPPNYKACYAFGGCPHRTRCESDRKTAIKPTVDWDQILARFGSDDAWPPVGTDDLSNMVHLWGTEERVPERVTYVLATLMGKAMCEVHEGQVLPYMQDGQVRRADPKTVADLRVFMRWHKQSPIEIDEVMWQNVISYLSAFKARCENETCVKDEFCHCHFRRGSVTGEPKEGSEMNKIENAGQDQTDQTQGRDQVQGQTQGQTQGFVLVYGALWKGKGLVLSEFLAPIKERIAQQEGLGHYLQRRFAELRPEVISQGLAALRKIGPRGFIVVDQRCEAESEIARMLTPEASAVIGSRF